ncbi:MAG TPA: 50S ribosomal protein L25 [Conexibacter sp.]|nr:50S ribosomal protein L25 [Conexibacter sp.]
MADDTTTLTVSPRTVEGSRANRRLRRTGLVPGVVYGGEGEPIAFQVDARTLRQALAHGGAVISLTVEGEGETPVVLKDQQRHPVTGATMHVDLLRVDLRQKIGAVVVLELTGVEDAPGVKAGGVLEQVTRELNIEALPTAIPDTIELDVSNAEIGDTIALAAVTAPEGVELLDDPETVVVTVTPPRLSAEPSEELETETEVVGEGGGEAEASAEGESSEGGE